MKAEETRMKEEKLNLTKEFLLSILMAITFGTGLWIIETLLFLISKFRHPGIWFYLPLKIWLLYLVTGTALALLSWLASLFALKKGGRTSAKFRKVSGSIFISSFLTIYLIALSLRVSYHILEGTYYILHILIILIISILAGVSLYTVYHRIGNLLKISPFLVAICASFLVLSLTAFDINANLFPKITTTDYLRNAQSRPNVLVIVIDALRADHLSCLGYRNIETPNIDKIASEGVLFTNCIAQAPWTLPSVGSIFTSKYPSQHGAERQQIRRGLGWDNVIPVRGGYLYEENTTFAEILKANGYYTVTFQPNINLLFAAGFAQGVDFHLDCHKYHNLLLERLAEYTTERKVNQFFYPSYKFAEDEKIVNYMKNWLTINNNTQFFMHALLFDTHEYHLEEKGKKGRYHIPSVELYDAFIKKTDEQIGEIYNYMKGMRLLDQTIIVLLSDHGEEFGDHGGYDRGYSYDYDSGRMHAHTLYDELIRIPLIIRYPGKIKGNMVVNQQVRSIDILPTILSLLEISYEGRLEGVDLSENDFKPGENLRAFSESILEGSEKKSLRTRDWKLIYHPVSQRYELYNLAKDPKEKVNLVNKEKEAFASLQRELFSWIERMEEHGTKAKKKRKLSDEEIDALKALGYLFI